MTSIGSPFHQSLIKKDLRVARNDVIAHLKTHGLVLRDIEPHHDRERSSEWRHNTQVSDSRREQVPYYYRFIGFKEAGKWQFSSRSCRVDGI